MIAKPRAEKQPELKQGMGIRLSHQLDFTPRDTTSSKGMLERGLIASVTEVIKILRTPSPNCGGQARGVSPAFLTKALSTALAIVLLYGVHVHVHIFPTAPPYSSPYYEHVFDWSSGCFHRMYGVQYLSVSLISLVCHAAHAQPSASLGWCLAAFRPPFPHHTRFIGGNYTFSNVFKRANGAGYRIRRHPFIRSWNDRHPNFFNPSAWWIDSVL
jgi:hypothetical protein